MLEYSPDVWLVIVALLVLTVALGLPLFHYVTALMIAVVLRHGRGGEGLLAPLGGQTGD